MDKGDSSEFSGDYGFERLQEVKATGYFNGYGRWREKGQDFLLFWLALLDECLYPSEGEGTMGENEVLEVKIIDLILDLCLG